MRGCGHRVPGGCYLVCPLGPNGMPVEAFLADPPIRIPPNMELAYGLSNIGVRILERTPGSGIYDVWDIVGEGNYPNVADVIQETKKMGVSRRVSVTEDFAKLNHKSRLILLHRRAWIENYDEYYGAMWIEAETVGSAFTMPLACPRVKTNVGEVHNFEPDSRNTEMCLGIAYDDVTGGERQYDPTLPPRTVNRTIGSTTYLARHRPENVTPEYELAIFARFPIPRIEVIKDRDANKHVVSMAKASASSIAVLEVDE